MLVFLKLGGSLITDKDTPRAHRPDVLARLSDEIAQAVQQNPDLKLVIGHGSGSFGHQAAKKHATRQGVQSPTQWRGFAEVWHEARLLNQIVIESLYNAGLPVAAFPPSAGVMAENGLITSWDLTPLRKALEQSLIPIVNGDTVFDSVIGGTIASTEDVFFYLARQLHPRRILLAGIEAGVWADFPASTRLIPLINSANAASILASIGGSASVDVTGGMAAKVDSMLNLARSIPGLEISIFSGARPGLLRQALSGRLSGTQIYE
ncbi:MAG TPA: isopentenyl phosphate kinase [Anaerolineaceae bacterium]|nr:isopentenyl phosphate kinase [Anaerolineaceae bacterium]HPN51075.1 isopentenyl phosphate kinase [Anaerolineaceae bacterium]